MRLAVVGAGWAGLAAALAATQAGHQVTVYEAARVLGGRARTLSITLPNGDDALIDNGQHILIGAYVQTLRLMQKVGVDPALHLLRVPLALRFPDGGGLALPPWPAPWNVLGGIAGARGWSWADKFALLRSAARWQRANFQCDAAQSVADLCGTLTPSVRAELIEPLCVSALNTPIDRASGQVFLRILRDALFSKGHAGWGGADLLLPKQDLGRLFPEAAASWLANRGACVRTGSRVQTLQREPDGWRVEGESSDQVILACPPGEALRLAQAHLGPNSSWAQRAGALQHEAIATVYASGGPRLPAPMLALRSGPDAPAQFVFDRCQLGGPSGLLAFVVSASTGDRESLEQRVLQQASGLGWQLTAVKTVVEKRATFACSPGLQRPGQSLAPGLWACGDYVDGPYPATLEGAVLSALNTIAAIDQDLSAAARKAR